MRLKESEDYLLASLMSVHYMIKDLDLDLKAGKISSAKKKYRFMLNAFQSLKEEFITWDDLSLRFANKFSYDIGLIELGIIGKETLDDKVSKCIIAISMYDFMNYR